MAGLTSERNESFQPPARFLPGTRQSSSLAEPAFLMRTSAPVALWWNRGLLNHTAEPLKSAAAGSAQPSDQTEIATLHWSKVLAGRVNGEGGGGGAEGRYCI